MSKRKDRVADDGARPTVGALVNAVEGIAPLALAEPWDRVGLHIGRRDDVLTGPVLLTIDLTEDVMDEAVSMGASAIVSYHPPIWEPLTTLTDATAPERIARRAVAAGIAVYSPHTALDATPGGVTDWLCEGISGSTEAGVIRGDCRALVPACLARGGEKVKLVTFVPEGDVDTVRNALGTAGAGVIGAYRLCSFGSVGEGTFFGGAGSHQQTGKSGRLERVEERRLEMVCSRSALPLAVETLRHFHPYEEPAFDIYELVPAPERQSGPGRRLVLDQPATLAAIAGRLRTHLGRSRLKVAYPNREGDDGKDRAVRSIGVVPGAGASLLERAAAEGCELFITGEMRHHDVLAAQNRGVRVMLAGHTNTERGYLPRLVGVLGSRLAGLDIQISQRDRDPLVEVTSGD
jgi:dinuclear metal center YbgI/SA1388 family protein